MVNRSGDDGLMLGCGDDDDFLDDEDLILPDLLVSKDFSEGCGGGGVAFEGNMLKRETEKVPNEEIAVKASSRKRKLPIKSREKDSRKNLLESDENYHFLIEYPTPTSEPLSSTSMNDSSSNAHPLVNIHFPEIADKKLSMESTLSLLRKSSGHALPLTSNSKKAVTWLDEYTFFPRPSIPSSELDTTLTNDLPSPYLKLPSVQAQNNSNSTKQPQTPGNNPKKKKARRSRVQEEIDRISSASSSLSSSSDLLMPNLSSKHDSSTDNVSTSISTSLSSSSDSRPESPSSDNSPISDLYQNPKEVLTVLAAQSAACASCSSISISLSPDHSARQKDKPGGGRYDGYNDKPKQFLPIRNDFLLLNEDSFTDEKEEWNVEMKKKLDLIELMMTSAL